MKYLLFAEGFMLRGKFVFKEIAFYCTETGELKQFIITSSRKLLEQLNRRETRTVMYCQNNLHKINWGLRGKNFHFVRHLINRQLTSEDIIYTKGLQMKKFIELQINPRCRVVNVETIINPENWLDKSNTVEEGGIHKCVLSFHDNIYHCAVNKAHICFNLMRESLESNLETSELNVIE